MKMTEIILPQAPRISNAPPWNLEQAIELCKKLEVLCPQAGCHVALTG